MEIDVNSRRDSDLGSMIVESGVFGSEFGSIVPESRSAGLLGSLQDSRQFTGGEEPDWSVLALPSVIVNTPQSPKFLGPDVEISGEARRVCLDRVAGLDW